jgi:hypothetical protein
MSARSGAGSANAFVTTGIEAGGTLLVPGVSSGVRFFECLIHPWMRTTVHIRGGR